MDATVIITFTHVCGPGVSNRPPSHACIQYNYLLKLCHKTVT